MAVLQHINIVYWFEAGLKETGGVGFYLKEGRGGKDFAVVYRVWGVKKGEMLCAAAKTAMK